MAATATKALSVATLTRLMREAHEAGMKAGRSVGVAPMVVSKHANPLDDSSPVEKAWIVPDGPCGFAWVTIRPANSRAAKVMASMFTGKTGGGHAKRNEYEGGMMLWVWEFNQSLTRKEAYAYAFAKHLTDAGIPKVYAGSRMD